MEIRTIRTGPADLAEIRRYMGYYHVSGWEKQPGDVFDLNGNPVYADTDRLIGRALLLTEGILENRVLYSVFPISICREQIRFGNSVFRSKDLAARLAGCEEMVLFTATSGFALDRLIEKYKRLEPSVAYALSMVGTEHTEALLDGFCTLFGEELKEEKKELTLRYSPGYGDLPLNVQPLIFSELDITRKLGITLNDSMLMTPVKSVTAIAGIRKNGTAL